MGLEHIVASRVAKATTWAAGKLYRVDCTELSKIEEGKAAIIAIKHRSNMDGVVAIAMLANIKNRVVVPAKKQLFKWYYPCLGFLLAEYGCFPITQPDDEGYEVKSSENGRKLIRSIKEKQWYAYFPEVHRHLDYVGEIRLEYAKPIIVGQRMGANVYAAVLIYGKNPLWRPRNKITLRIEKFDFEDEKTVHSELERKFSELTGIKRKSATRNN